MTLVPPLNNLCRPATSQQVQRLTYYLLHGPFISGGTFDEIFAMTRFRPCIDLHAGQVKQIVGGTLDSSTSELKTNYVSPHPPAYFANLYRENGLTGAHVIMLGPGNDRAARESLAAWPGKLQVGGGINDKNARQWTEAGAEKVCI